MRDIFCVVTKNQKHSYNLNQDGHAKVVSPSFFVSDNKINNTSQETQEMTQQYSKESRALAELELGMLEKGFQSLQLRTDNNSLHEDAILKQAFQTYQNRLREIRSILLPKNISK